MKYESPACTHGHTTNTHARGLPGKRNGGENERSFVWDESVCVQDKGPIEGAREYVGGVPHDGRAMRTTHESSDGGRRRKEEDFPRNGG
jgi:hypothetical protein